MMLSVMYMNWKNIIWETVKTFGPAIVAWLLAVYSSHRNASKEWEKMMTQLELTKENNAQVQNKAYKLQFCLKQLEELTQMYEEEISRLNIVINTVHSFAGLVKTQSDNNVMVMKTAQDALAQLHVIMMHNGSLVSVINAISNEHKEFDKLQSMMKEESAEAEATLHFLNVGLEKEMTVQQFLGRYNELTLVVFNEILVKTHVYLMRQINRLFKEMD